MEEIEVINRRQKLRSILKNFIHVLSPSDCSATNHNIEPRERDNIGLIIGPRKKLIDGDLIKCRINPDSLYGESHDFLFPHQVTLRVGTEPGEVFIGETYGVFPSSRYCFSCDSRKMYDQNDDEYFCPIHDEVEEEEEAKGLLQAAINIFS